MGLTGNRILFLILGAYLLSNSPLSASPLTVFYTDFESGLPDEFSGIISPVPTQGHTTVESTQGYAAFGFGLDFLRNATGGSFGGYGSDGDPSLRTTLTLTGLPQHDSINLSFFLAIIDSWDGSYSGNGPDFFNVTVDGQTLFSETFSTRPESTYVQSYAPPTGGLLTPMTDQWPRNSSFFSLGFRDIYGDAAYNMGLDPVFSHIAHTGNTLTLEWFTNGAGWQGGLDESWAIDDVRVEINPVLEPSSLALLGVGLAGVGFLLNRNW